VIGAAQVRASAFSRDPAAAQRGWDGRRWSGPSTPIHYRSGRVALRTDRLDPVRAPACHGPPAMINSYPVRTPGVRDPHSSYTRTVGGPGERGPSLRRRWCCPICFRPSLARMRPGDLPADLYRFGPCLTLRSSFQRLWARHRVRHSATGPPRHGQCCNDRARSGADHFASGPTSAWGSGERCRVEANTPIGAGEIGRGRRRL
jgi:hypothetical protein